MVRVSLDLKNQQLIENAQKKEQNQKKRRERRRMAKRNLGFLMRQLLVSSNNPGAGAGVGFLLHHRRLFVSSSTLTLPRTPPRSIIPSYSLHSLQHRRSPRRRPESDSDWDLDSDLDMDLCEPLPPFRFWEWMPDEPPPPPYPPNAVHCQSPCHYDEAIKQIQDERLSAVLFFTAEDCRTTPREIHPLFLDLCKECKHMKMYVFPLRRVGTFSMHVLGLKSPTFQFYRNGEKVKELSTGSMRRVFKTVENLYSPSGMKKRIRRQGSKEAKKEEVDPSKLSEVLPSRFHASEVPKVMEVLESLPEAEPLSDLWWFARGLFTSHEMRERFSELEDDQVKLEWLNREMDE